jgi:hypothetical protein
MQAFWTFWLVVAVVAGFFVWLSMVAEAQQAKAEHRVPFVPIRQRPSVNPVEGDISGDTIVDSSAASTEE